MHDTLTFSEDLFREPSHFYRLGEKIAGSNYLKTPHTIHPPTKERLGLVESESPPWLEMHIPNSLAAWILYYIERAFFASYQYAYQFNYSVF